MPTTFDLLASTTLSSATSSITFSSISSAYSELRLISNFGTTSGFGCDLRLNGATSNYYALQTYQDGTSVAGGEIGAIGYGPFAYYTGRALSSGGNSIVGDFYNYQGGQNKGYFFLSNLSQGVGEGFGVTTQAVGGALTSLTIITGSSIEAGSKFSLYGMLRG